MRGTRRLWATAAVGIVYAGVAIAAGQPLALVGTVGIGTWLIGTAWAAENAFREFDTAADIAYSVESETTQVESTTTVTLSVSRPADTAETAVTVTPIVPAGVTVTGDVPTLRLKPGETTATTAFPVRTAVAGVFTLSSPKVGLTDAAGLYTETIARGAAPTLTVLPRTPTVHIGKGGEAYGNAFGEHPTDRPGPGIAVRELRQYIAGEDAMNIDWKSTARLGEPYVRETEGETDRKTVLVVDHRSQTGEGGATEPPIEFAREAALAMTAGAVQANDPLSLWTVGDAGISERIVPGSDPGTYNQIRSSLFGLEPTPASPNTRTAQTEITEITQRLPDESAFAQTLHPFTTRRMTQADHHGDGFTTAIKRVRSEFGADAWVVMITTDENPAQLRRSVQVATEGGAEVCVLIMPTVLFESEGLDTITQTYKQYMQFEELRRELDAHPRVVALELAPGDRLSAVLSARQQGEKQRGTSG